MNIKYMQKTKILTKLIIAVFFLTAGNVLNAQIYHEECKEDLREFMRQGTNYEKLGLSETDTNSWYADEEWVPKVEGVTWIETYNFYLRIEEFWWNYLDLDGKFKFRSPELIGFGCNNNLTELDVSSNTQLIAFSCSYNSLTSLDVSNNFGLTHIFCDNNKLTTLKTSADTTWWTGLMYFCCENNSLKLSTFPILLRTDHYLFFPQDTINGGIIGYADVVDLSTEYDVRGYITNFEWFDITEWNRKRNIATNK